MEWLRGSQGDNDRCENCKYPRLRSPNDRARGEDEQGEAKREGAHGDTKQRCANKDFQGAVHTHAGASVDLDLKGSP
uniref:Uncharacterized protein n=1 Tax=Pseudomonas fluorescens (strain SBW25) TaxID=216595 RepID=A0A0G4E504_PSEFS|nr:hypothetical protein PQBR57_0130 [Pseudomonas fluorescens SBW25]